MFKIGLLCLTAAGTLGAQAILQQGVAAASGTLAGTLAGKSLSDALDKTLQATDSAAQTGADFKPWDSASRARSTQIGQAPAPVSAASGAGSLAGIGKHGGASSPRGRNARSPGRGGRLYSPPTPPAADAGASFAWTPEGNAQGTPPAAYWPDVSREQVRTIELGWVREKVVDHLGGPAATVWIPEEGGLRQVLYYTGRGDMVGSVGIGVDGMVSEVRVNP
jgi:hypothetical protein